MRWKRADEVSLVRYLLGDLPEDEQVRVEDRALADANYRGELEAAEADLIDDYVHGRLSQADRRSFERMFLAAPQRRKKVEFARALANVAAGQQSRDAVTQRLPKWRFPAWLVGPPGNRLRLAAGLAALICVAGASWLAVRNSAMRSRVTALEAERRGFELREQSLRRQLGEEQARAGKLAAELTRQTPDARRAPLVASLVLLPNLSRSARNLPRLVLSPSTQLARIEIPLEARDDYARFRVELRTGSGDEVLMRDHLTRRRTSAGYVVSLEAPASALAAGDYELALKGVAGDQATEDIGYYYFSVQRQ